MTQNAAGWHPEDIKAALVKRHGSICRLSETWKLHRTAISRSLKNPRARSARVELRIAKALGVSPHELWPDRWTAEIPMRPVRRAKPNTARSGAGKRQNGAAA